MKAPCIATSSGYIRIDNPPGKDPSVPLCAQLDSGNFLNASGGANDPSVNCFIAVQAQIYGTSINVTGNITGKNWNIPGLGPLTPGTVYQLVINAQVNVSSGATLPCTTSRSFIAVNASYSCPPGHSSGELSAIPGVLPRYYRMRLQDELPDPASPIGSLTLGGLLEPGNIYLEFDSDVSTSSTFVWRDINRPDFIGRWTLRATRTCRESKAELVHQILGACDVRTSMCLSCERWSPQGPSLFVLAQAADGSVRSGSLIVAIEPA